MKASEFDQQFDADEDLTAMRVWSRVRRLGIEQKHMNVDFPTRIVLSFDKEGRRLGVTRQSLIKLWLAEKLKRRDAQ